MTDITKCASKGCTRAENCYRKTAPDGKHQSYSEFTPENPWLCFVYKKIEKGWDYDKTKKTNTER